MYHIYRSYDQTRSAEINIELKVHQDGNTIDGQMFIPLCTPHRAVIGGRYEQAIEWMRYTSGPRLWSRFCRFQIK